MSWKCPVCFRSFKNANQSHSCVQVKEEDLFINKPIEITQLYQMLREEVRNHVGIHEPSVSQTVITLRHESSFLGIHPSKKWIDLDFFLNQEVEEFPIIKVERISKNRVMHRVRIESREDLDAQLIQWIKASYDLLMT